MRKVCIAIFFLIFTTQVYSQCCLRLDDRKCLQCPNGTHLFRGNCIIDVMFCSTYKDGFDCDTCSTGYQLNATGDCEKIPPVLTTSAPILSSTPVYTEVMIDTKNPQGTAGDIYGMADDFLRGTNPVIATANVLGARIRTYRNNTAEVTIQYEVVKNTNYRAVMQVNVDSMIMKQISFSKVTDLILAKPAATSLPAQTTTPASATAQAPTSNTVTTPTSTSANTSPPATTATVTVNTVIQPADSAYIIFNPADPFDQFYSVCKDVISTQGPDYTNIQPIMTKKYVQGSITYYLLRFTKADGSVWDIYMKFDSDSYTAKIDRTNQIAPSTKPLTTAYKSIALTQIYKDIDFIMVSDYINKQSNNKYKDAVIRSVDKMSNPPIDTYKVNYQYGGRVWEVLASINTNTFALSGYSQTQGDLINKTTQAATITAANPRASTTANPSASTIVTPPSNIASTAINNAINTAASSTGSSNNQVNNNNNNQQSSSGGSSSAVTSLVNPNSLNIVPYSAPSPTVFTSMPPSTIINTLPTSSTGSTSPSSSPTTSTTSQPPVQTPSSSNSNSNGNSNNNGNGNGNNKANTQIKLPSAIQQLASGLTPMNRTDMQATEFKDIDNLIRSANSNQLKNAILAGAYVKVSSFTKNYQIYYMADNQEIYSAVVSRDQLRKRTYIISFGKLGY